jgi:hypothetical protein
MTGDRSVRRILQTPSLVMVFLRTIHVRWSVQMKIVYAKVGSEVQSVDPVQPRRRIYVSSDIVTVK